jgi:O-antigen ligase
MELKHYIFLAMSMAFIPTAAWLGIRYRWAERLLVAATFFSTCYLIDINILSMETYRGDTRGFEFGTTDWMVLSLMLVMTFSPRWRKKRPELLPPNASLLLLYLVLAFSSLFVSEVPIFGAFGLSKIVRAMLVYWLAYNYLRTERDLRFFLLILASIVAFEFLLVLYQRSMGIYRATGTLPHSNTLALYINMMNMIFMSFAINDRKSGWHRYVYWAALAMGSLIVLATFSRGALVVMTLCYGLVVALSMFDRVRMVKVRTVVLLCLLALPLAVKVAPSIIERFKTAPVNSELSRQQANQAAIAMANSSWLGIGLNNYSYSINETHFSQYVPAKMDRGIVHNIYLLHAAEMGWLGLLLFLLLIANFMLMALRLIVMRIDNIVSWVAIGLFAGMTSLWVQSALEWAFRQTYITVEFFMLAGFLAALPRVLAHQAAGKRLRARWWAWWLIARQRSRVAPSVTGPTAY